MNSSISASVLLLLATCSRAWAGDDDEHDGVAGREFRVLQMRSADGIVHDDRLQGALEQMGAMRAAQAEQAEELGVPGGLDVAGIDPAAWIWLGPGNAGGRIRAIIVHPIDPNRMWVGSAGGGIWYSSDAGAGWQPVNNFAANLVVSSMVLDPTNPNVMYTGTGESFAADLGATEGQDIASNGQRGAGVFKSTDGGVTWGQLPSTRPSDPAACASGSGVACPWSYVNRLAISPDGAKILAATTAGLQMSLDGGTTWNAGAFLSGNIQDADFDPTNGSKAVAAGVRADRVMTGLAAYSTDGGASWIQATFSDDGGASYAATLSGRVEIAYAPSNPAIVYISVAQTYTDGAMMKSEGDVYRSSDGGHRYIRVNARNNLLGGQGGYDNIIWVNPQDPNFVIVGGVLPFRSTDGGVTFSPIGDSSTNLPHTDHHMIVAHPGFNNTTNRTAFFSNDGGIFRMDDVAVPSPAATGWTSLNNHLGITQFYSAAGNAGGIIIAGSQDNGTLRYAGNPDGWSKIPGMSGDGGFCAADPTDPNYFYGEYTLLRLSRSTNAGVSGSAIFSGISDAGVQGAANFIAPFILDPGNPNTILAGGVSLWRSTDVKAATPAWSAIKSPVSDGLPSPSNIPISAIAVSPVSSDLIVVGHNNGQIFISFNGTDAAPLWSKISIGTPARFVTRLVIDETRSPSWIYATFGGFAGDNIYRSTNLGSSWTAVTGTGLNSVPSVPVRSLLINPVHADYLYAGTEIGVFASEDAGATWKVPQDGPASISVEELSWLNGDLVAATFGRGVYKTFSSVYNLPVCLGGGSGFWDDPLTWSNHQVPTINDDVVIQCPVTVRSSTQVRSVRVNNRLVLNAPLLVGQDVVNFGTVSSELASYSFPLLSCRNLSNSRPARTATTAGIIELPGGISATGNVVNGGFLALGANLDCVGLDLTTDYSSLTLNTLTAKGDVHNAGTIEGQFFATGTISVQHLSGAGAWRFNSFVNQTSLVFDSDVKFDIASFNSNGALDFGASTLTFTGATFSNGAASSGTGELRLAPSSGSAVFGGNAPALSIGSGTVRDQSGGTVGGVLKVDAGATFQLTASHVTVRGDITVDGAITKENVFGGNILDFFGQEFTNNGSVSANLIRFNPSGPVPLAQSIAGAGAWSGDAMSLGNGSAAAPSTVTLHNDLTVGCDEFDIGYSLILNGHTLTYTGAGSQTGVGLSLSGAIEGAGPVKMQPAGGSSKIRSLSGSASFTPALEIVSGTVTANSFFATLFLKGTLTIDPGATFTLAGSGVTVSGDVLVNGLLNQEAGSSPLLTCRGNLFHNGGSILTSVGIFGANPQNLEGAGSWGGGDTVLYMGSSPDSITALQSDVAFAGGTFAIFGRLNTGAFTLSMPCTVAAYPFSTGEVVGRVRRTNLAACPGATLSFGNPYTTIKFSSGVPPTEITVDTDLSAPPSFLGAIQRTYVITPTGGSGYTATLRLHYLDSELNGNDEATLQLVRQGGGGWNQAGASNRNTSDNWVEYSDVTQFSPWTLSSLAPSTGFAQWRTEFFTPAELADPAISGDLADPDHDRLVNLMEYALHLDPTRPSSAGSPYLEKSPASLSLIYTKVIGATDLIYAVEKSSDLIKWAPASPVDLILSDDGVTQTIRAQVPTLGVARMDLRLRVSN